MLGLALVFVLELELGLGCWFGPTKALPETLEGGYSLYNYYLLLLL